MAVGLTLPLVPLIHLVDLALSRPWWMVGAEFHVAQPWLSSNWKEYWKKWMTNIWFTNLAIEELLWSLKQYDYAGDICLLFLHFQLITAPYRSVHAAEEDPNKDVDDNCMLATVIFFFLSSPPLFLFLYKTNKHLMQQPSGVPAMKD